MSIVVDIRTRVFDEDERAYRLFPGQGYRYYEFMKDHSVVFLDNPGIPVPGPQGYQKDDATLHALVRSELKQPVVLAASDRVREEIAEIDARDLGDVRWSRRREVYLGWLNALYRDASIGDLVIVPSPGYVKEGDDWVKVGTMIGEIVSGPERLDRGAPVSILAGRYLVRRVRWLAEVDELELSRSSAAALRTQNALVALPARSFEKALGAAYKNLVIGDEFLARFTTESEDFNAAECFHFTAFAMAVVAAVRQIEQGYGPFRDGRSIYDLAAAVPPDDEYVPEQEASIHSPGYTTLRGLRQVPAVISILFALALTPGAQPFAGEGPAQVEVVNTESTAYNPCDVGIEESVRQSLDIIGYERWLQMCQAAARANENEGLKSITTVDVPDPQAEQDVAPETESGEH